MARIPDIMDLIGGANRDLNPEALKKFLAGAGARNQNLSLGPYNAYLRRSVPRFIEKGVELKRPVDLARIDRTDVEGQIDFEPAKFRNPKGKFRQLMAMLEKEAASAGYDSVYVEQIMNKFLPDVLGSMGYSKPRPTFYSRADDIPSMYKRLR